MPTVGRVRTKIEGAGCAPTVKQKAEAAALRALLERAAQQAARLSAIVGGALELERRRAEAAQSQSAQSQSAQSALPAPGDPPHRLTPRERQVLDLVAQGRSSKEIARSLGITRATARCHVQNVLTKLGVGSRVRAAALAAPPGVAQPEVAQPGVAQPGSAPAVEHAADHATHGKLRKLTRRETEVLRALAAGLEKREIAARLYLSPHTVRTHVQRVLAKLDVHSVLGALALARSVGLPPLDTWRGSGPQADHYEGGPGQRGHEVRDRIRDRVADHRNTEPARGRPAEVRPGDQAGAVGAERPR